MGFRYIRKQRTGVVQQGHVPPYILNGGEEVSDLVVFSGSFNTNDTVIDPLGPSPATLTNNTGQNQFIAGLFDRNTLNLIHVYKTTTGDPSVSSGGYGSRFGVAAPLGDRVVHSFPINNFTSGLQQFFYDIAQVFEANFAPSVGENDRVVGTWFRYDLEGNFVDVNFYVNTQSGVTLGPGWYNLFATQTRFDDALIHVTHCWRAGTTLVDYGTTYAEAQAAAVNFVQEGQHASVLVSKFDATGPVAGVGTGYDDVRYTGAGNPAQMIPRGASDVVKNDFFAFAGQLYNNSGPTPQWTFNFGRASAFTQGMPATTGAFNTGFVTKYRASDLVAQWSATIGSAGDSGGSTSTPWNTSINLGDFYQGVWQSQQYATGCDITADGSVCVAGKVNANASTFVIASSAGVTLATAAITDIDPPALTNPYHGYLVKLASNGASVDWVQVIESVPTADFAGIRCNKVVVKEALDAVFVYGCAASVARFYADAGNAGNSYTRGGVTTDRAFREVTSADVSGVFVARYNLTTGAFEGVYTIRSTASFQSQPGNVAQAIEPNAMTDVLNGLVLSLTLSNNDAVELDPEGPSPSTLAALASGTRRCMVKLDYDLGLLVTNPVWGTVGSQYNAACVPVAMP